MARRYAVKGVERHKDTTEPYELVVASVITLMAHLLVYSLKHSVR